MEDIAGETESAIEENHVVVGDMENIKAPIKSCDAGTGASLAIAAQPVVDQGRNRMQVLREC